MGEWVHSSVSNLYFVQPQDLSFFLLMMVPYSRTMISKIIKEGRIVPSEVTVKLLQKAIASSQNDKFLIDGFPRNEENRLSYERTIGAEPNIVIFLDCPEEEMVKRVLNRNQGRIDDKNETIIKRIEVFRAVSLPVIDYYSKKGKLYKIDGTGTVDEVFERVSRVFAALKFNKISYDEIQNEKN
ncbi:hypothetical protein M9H77_31496 [Catharanthus roseus]|uniref:Uncharacterized protein n=1 Tax=Catharanthus roseus TaxID=4058 RepID=A0ACC0A0L5_CATRO|nr:hypothetical protein M9H77_31496 [Catharanthus roseus]